MASPDELRSFEIFKWANSDTLKTLAVVSEDLDYEEGEQLFAAGDEADQLFVLAEGTVDILYATGSGEKRLVDTIEAGDIIGWSVVLEPYAMTAFAVARSACKTIAVDAIRLRQLIKEDVEFGDALMAVIARVTAHRLRGAREQIARLS